MLLWNEYFRAEQALKMDRLMQVESLKPIKRLTASFKPVACTPSSAIILVDDKRKRVCMVTKRKKIDFGGQTVSVCNGENAELDTESIINCLYLERYFQAV